MMNIKRTAEGCRSRRGPRRVVSGRERVLGAEGGTLVTPAGQREATDHRQANRRGDPRDRGGDSRPERRPAQGL